MGRFYSRALATVAAITWSVAQSQHSADAHILSVEQGVDFLSSLTAFEDLDDVSRGRHLTENDVIGQDTLTHSMVVYGRRLDLELERMDVLAPHFKHVFVNAQGETVKEETIDEVAANNCLYRGKVGDGALCLCFCFV
jgi:hypothetical protein